MILALDPGESKIGWALVGMDGRCAAQGILPAASWTTRLPELADLREVAVAVIGDGTARVNIEHELSRLLPQAGIVVVNEKESTVEGWQLKRAEQAGGNPLRAMALTLGQLFNAGPVDDYAARVLALRYLRDRTA